MGEQHVLDLARVDVDAAPQHHVARAVGEVEVAVVVEVTDVADRERVVAPRGRCLRVITVVVEAPTTRRAGVDETFRTRRQLVARRRGCAPRHRATACRPSPGRSRHSAAVIRVTPPSLAPYISLISVVRQHVEDASLHVDRARRAGLDEQPQRGQVVRRSHVVRHLEDPDQMRRGQERCGDAVPVDGGEELARVPRRQRDDGAAEPDRREAVATRTGVVARTGQPVDVVGREAPHRDERCPRLLHRRRVGLAVHDAFGPAGRARGVEHPRRSGPRAVERRIVFGGECLLVRRAGDEQRAVHRGGRGSRDRFELG